MHFLLFVFLSTVAFHPLMPTLIHAVAMFNIFV